MTDSSPEPVQAANFLVNDAKTYASLIPLIRELPPELAELLREAHNKIGWGCSAHSEGLMCCLDILLADPDDYSPGKVASAKELIAQYRTRNRPV